MHVIAKIEAWLGSVPPWTTVIAVSILTIVVFHRLFRKRGNSGEQGAETNSWPVTGQELDTEWKSARRGGKAEDFCGGGRGPVSKSRLLREDLSGASSEVRDEGRSDAAEEKEEASAPSGLSNEEVEIVREEAVGTAPSAPSSADRPLQKSPRRVIANHRSPDRRSTHAPPQRETETKPPLRSSARHPGLGEFRAWNSAISELYRSYTVGKVDGSTPPLPAIPKSERGRVRVHLEVRNGTSRSFDVYWVDYLGREDHRGSVRPGSTWTQQTWVGHPWTFRDCDGGWILMHFVPFQVIPTTDRVPTVNRDGEGLQRFTIMPPSRSAMTAGLVCDIDDPVLPHPPYLLSPPMMAFQWSLQHMEREGSSPRTLMRYLRNILRQPGDRRYRQIRTANRTFRDNVWFTAGRGVLHALGFEEQGAYVEIGPPEGFLPPERLKEVSMALAGLEGWLTEQEGTYRET